MTLYVNQYTLNKNYNRKFKLRLKSNLERMINTRLKVCNLCYSNKEKCLIYIIIE